MHRSLGVLAGGAALILAASACGGSSTSAVTTTTPAAPTTTGAPSTTPPATAAPSTTAPATTTPATTAPPLTTTTVAPGAGLASLALSAAEVTQLSSTLVTEQATPSGTALSVPTIDICTTPFASEKLRVARYQVTYLDGNGQSSASNEVVKYSAGGADESYQELRAAVAAPCPTASGLSQLQAAPADPHLAAQQVILTAVVSSSGGTPVYTAAAYQYQGNVLSAIYTFRTTKALALQSAESIATGATAKLKAGTS